MGGETLTVLWTESGFVQYDRLITGVAVVFGLLTAVLTVVGLVSSPAVLFLALMFGASTYLMYYHLSGKMAASVYERVERRAARNGAGARRGGFDAGPREEWKPPRDGQRRRNADRRRRQARQQGKQRRRRRSVQQSSGPSPSEAYNRLGLEPSASDSAVKQAYRERVKEVHPDTEGGSEREFKRVKAAYERLTEN